MNVLFDYQIFALQQYGGVSRYFCSLLESLAQGVDVNPFIAAPVHINEHMAHVPPRMRFGRRVPRIPIMGPALTVTNKIIFAYVSRRLRPDVIHETYYTRGPTGPRSIPQVVTIHDFIHERFPQSFSPHDARESSARKRAAAQRAHHVICVSENTRNDAIELLRLDPNRVSVIHLASQLDANHAVTLPRQINDTKPFLLYVGTRHEYKNFGGFLRAWASSDWLKKNLRIVCFGGGSFTRAERAFFTELALHPDEIEHRSGDDHALAAAYRQAAALVYPSKYEGFGLPPLEAMSVGCPVACSNTSSLPEVVGEAASLFDPYDADSMRHAIESIVQLTSRQQELRTLGLERAEQFSWAKCATQTRAVYQRLL